MNLQDFFESLDRAQQRVRQLPADFRPADTSPQLAGPYPGRNATQGYLVGEGEDDLSWSDLDQGLTVQDRMDIFETHYSGQDLRESLDPKRREQFQNLWSMGDQPQQDRSYIVVPLALIADRVRQLDPPRYLRYLGDTQDQRRVFLYQDRKITYPSSVIRDLALYNVFTFQDPRAYDRFRNMLALSFDVRLPEVEIKQSKNSMAEGHADQQRKIFRRNGQPVGEVGIDRESSPGVGQYYMKHYASNTDNSGYHSREEALDDLRHVMNQSIYGELREQGVAEATGDKPFDQMMRMIKKGTKKQATADRRARDAASRERARAAFGPSPADKLSIGSDKGVSEGSKIAVDRKTGKFYDPDKELDKLLNQHKTQLQGMAAIEKAQSSAKKAKPKKPDVQEAGVSEAGVTWHGTQSGREEAAITDHTVYDAKQYLKANYPVVKTYNVRRAEPGFRILKRPDELRKSEAHIVGVDGAVDYLQLEKNAMMSGSSQWSASIGSSWSVYENTSNGIAIIYYQDRGMGSDSITVAGKTPKIQAQARQVFIDAGVLPEPKPRAGRSVDKPGVAESGWNPLDDERREQRAMDQERAQFKRDELEAELGDEEQRAQQIMQGTWYVVIDGRVWKRQGEPVAFQGKNAARRAGQTIKNRTPERTVTITQTLPTTENKAVSEIKHRLAQRIANEDVLGDMRQRLGDMIQAKAERQARRMARREIARHQPPQDVLGEPRRRIDLGNGEILEIHGNEDDGFRIYRGPRSMPTRFATQEHAEIAMEMYVGLAEGKKDACYHKVKSRVKIWPSAYASGQLVQCRKRGAANWGTGGQKKS